MQAHRKPPVYPWAPLALSALKDSDHTPCLPVLVHLPWVVDFLQHSQFAILIHETLWDSSQAGNLTGRRQ